MSIEVVLPQASTLDPHKPLSPQLQYLVESNPDSKVQSLLAVAGNKPYITHWNLNGWEQVRLGQDGSVFLDKVQERWFTWLSPLFEQFPAGRPRVVSSRRLEDNEYLAVQDGLRRNSVKRIIAPSMLPR